MTYQQTVEWMFRQLPMYQRVGAKAFKKDLSNTLKLAEHLGHPESKFKSIHVAGTNGKGSSSHMLASVMQAAGYKTGLYTSPHLKDFRERIKINGSMISQEAVVDFIEKNKDFLQENKLSFFELTVGMAFDHFAKEEVDVAVIEVGMGGRLDSTNIIKPEVCLITNIGLDHTKFLGDTLPKVAAEKAGVIKPGIPVVIGERQKQTTPVFERVAEENKAELIFAQDRKFSKHNTDLKGDFQNKNMKGVLATIEVLQKKGWNLREEDIKKGLNSVKLHTGLQGRWDVLQEHPRVICDTAHNKEGLVLAFKQLKKEEFLNLHIVLGVVNDKDLERVLPLFPKNASYYFCKPDVPRGLEAEDLKLKAAEYGLEGKVFETVKGAYETALAEALDEDLVFVGGSNFVVAEVV